MGMSTLECFFKIFFTVDDKKNNDIKLPGVMENNTSLFKRAAHVFPQWH